MLFFYIFFFGGGGGVGCGEDYSGDFKRKKTCGLPFHCVSSLFFVGGGGCLFFFGGGRGCQFKKIIQEGFGGGGKGGLGGGGGVLWRRLFRRPQVKNLRISLLLLFFWGEGGRLFSRVLCLGGFGGVWGGGSGLDWVKGENFRFSFLLSFSSLFFGGRRGGCGITRGLCPLL